jgi:hypothetical protein
MTPPTVCVADASALIELRHTYRMATFPALWRRLGELVNAGRRIVPREVRREVATDTELGPWVKQNRKIVVVLTCEKRGSATRPKIPDVCAYYEVPCLFGPRALGDMFEQEGWKFD